VHSPEILQYINSFATKLKDNQTLVMAQLMQAADGLKKALPGVCFIQFRKCGRRKNVTLVHFFGEQYFAVSQNNTLHIFSHGVQIEAAEVVPHQQPLGTPENRMKNSKS
jgi:hypothetical protein